MHLGAHAAPDVLRRPDGLAPLLAALEGCDRLVLLGDLLELRHGPVRDALRAAAEPLRAIGAALGPDREVVVLAGNHDHHLIAGWSERRAADEAPAPLTAETDVQALPGEPLGAVAELLRPARVRAAYPGVWLRPDVYATHGHYLDLHLTVPTLERLGAGVMRRIVGADGATAGTAEDYEMTLAPMYAWIHAIAQRADPDRSGMLGGGSVRGWQALNGPGPQSLRRRAMALAWPAAVATLNRARLGPLRPELSGGELRRAGLRAMGEVAARLHIRADHLVFGHTHRAGPVAGDDLAEWRTPGGAQLLNTGCWVDDDWFTSADPSRSPYRAGFAAVVEDDGPPRLVNLLDQPASPGVKQTP